MKQITFLFFILLLPFFTTAQTNAPQKESLVLDWPKNEHWIMGDDQENSRQHIIDLIHEGETVDKWTELANMTTVKGIRGIPIDTAMIIMFSSAKVTAPDAKLTFIKRGEMQECGWIIFSIESPHFDQDTTAESQLWLVVQGKQALYTNFVAVKAPALTEEFKTKWSTFFQKARLVYN